jgi:hypothetical protein
LGVFEASALQVLDPDLSPATLFCAGRSLSFILKNCFIHRRSGKNSQEVNIMKPTIDFIESSSNVIHLQDQEGDITITPSATRLLFGGPEGDDIKGVEVEFEIHLG